jgi:hypothetical protein
MGGLLGLKVAALIVYYELGKAQVVATHPGLVDGLVLWTAYPAASDDLSLTGVRVVSIAASLDELDAPEKIAASPPLLPSDTVWVTIEGGNHAQFGWYGAQSGDAPATITRESRQAQIIDTTVVILESLSDRQGSWTAFPSRRWTGWKAG